MFRKPLCVVLLLSLALAPFTLPTTAEAVDFFFSIALAGSQSASASFSHVDADDPCLITDAGVFAVEDGPAGGPPDPGGGASTLFLFVSIFNVCTGEQLFAAGGEALLSDEALQIDKDLNSATLSATDVVICDAVGGACSSVDVELAWTATGPLARSLNTTTMSSKGCKFHSFFFGKSRPAEASGSITTDDVNYAPDPAVFAQLAREQTGSVTLGCMG